MNINFNPSFQNITGLNIHGINQSAAGKKQGAEEQENNGMRLDAVLISPQGQSNHLIDMLMKQKISIKERMESLKSSAMEDGLSMDSIRAQLEEYEKQLKDIDSQVVEVMAKEMQKQTEKMQESRSKKPMTEEEAQRARMTNLMSLSNDVQQAETIQSVKTKVDGESGVLKSEIRLDKSRGGSIAGKEQKLAELEAKSAALTDEIGARAAQVNEKIKETGEMTVDKAEEAESNKEVVQEAAEEPEESTSVGGSIGINAGKLARKLAAAQTKAQVQAVIEEIKQDLKECEAGKEQGMDVDEASVKAAKNVLSQANQRMSEVANREATAEEEMAFSLAALM